MDLPDLAHARNVRLGAGLLRVGMGTPALERLAMNHTTAPALQDLDKQDLTAEHAEYTENRFHRAFRFAYFASSAVPLCLSWFRLCLSALHRAPAVGPFCSSVAVLLRFVLAVLTLLLCGVASGSQTNATDRTTLILVVGASGESEFGSNFVQQATLWQKACHQAGCPELVLGLENFGPTNDYEQLKQMLAAEPKDGPAALWLVLIGHGSFDGKEARFNLRGPDVTATELALWLRPFRRPLAVIDTSSRSEERRVGKEC